MLSYACTVHKIQGLNLDRVVVSFDLDRQSAFKSGQMYVALGRVTSLNGLFLIGEYNSNKIKADKNATEELERLRKECELNYIQDFNLMHELNFTVTLLNTIHSAARRMTDQQIENKELHAH